MYKDIYKSTMTFINRRLIGDYCTNGPTGRVSNCACVITRACVLTDMDPHQLSSVVSSAVTRAISEATCPRPTSATQPPAATEPATTHPTQCQPEFLTNPAAE